MPSKQQRKIVYNFGGICTGRVIPTSQHTKQQASDGWYPALDSDHSQVSGNSVRTLVSSLKAGLLPDNGTKAAGCTSMPSSYTTSTVRQSTVDPDQYRQRQNRNINVH